MRVHGEEALPVAVLQLHGQAGHDVRNVGLRQTEVVSRRGSLWFRASHPVSSTDHTPARMGRAATAGQSTAAKLEARPA